MKDGEFGPDCCHGGNGILSRQTWSLCGYTGQCARDILLTGFPFCFWHGDFSFLNLTGGETSLGASLQSLCRLFVPNRIARHSVGFRSEERGTDPRRPFVDCGSELTIEPNTFWVGGVGADSVIVAPAIAT